MRSWAAGPAVLSAEAAAAVIIQRVWRGWWSRRVLVDGVELSFNAICVELDGELLSRRPWSWPAVESSATRVIQRAVAAEADTPPRRCRGAAPTAPEVAAAAPPDHVTAPQHDLSPAADSTVGGTHAAAARSAPSTPLHCPAGTETSQTRLVGSSLLQDKEGPERREDVEQQLRPEGEVSTVHTSVEPLQERGNSAGSSAPANGGPPNGSSTPAALPAESGRGAKMSEAERRKAAEKLESELRWTEAALQSRVQHLIDTKQVALSATR
jgi:hypothetical protein